MVKATALERKLYKALKAASEHLDYIGYGDKWERECAKASGVEKKIEQALTTFEKAYQNKVSDNRKTLKEK